MDSRNYHVGKVYTPEHYRLDSDHYAISSYSSDSQLDVIIAVSVVLAILIAIICILCIYCTCLRTRRAEGLVYSVMSQPLMDGVIGTESSRNHATV